MYLFLQDSPFGDKFCFKHGYDHPTPLKTMIWYWITLLIHVFQIQLILTAWEMVLGTSTLPLEKSTQIIWAVEISRMC